MKAYQILKDSIGEENSVVGSMDSRQEELTYVEVAEDELNGEEYVYGSFDYEVTIKREKVATDKIEVEENEDRYFTPEGDDSGDATWGLKAERNRVQEYSSERDTESYTCNIGIEISEIQGVETGARVRMVTHVTGFNWGIWRSEGAQRVTAIPEFGKALLNADGELGLSYDIVLPSVEDFKTTGVKIYNTLMEYMVSMFYAGLTVVENYEEPDNGEEVELEV